MEFYGLGEAAQAAEAEVRDCLESLGVPEPQERKIVRRCKVVADASRTPQPAAREIRLIN